MGDVCIPLLAIVAGMLSAVYLGTGMVAGRFCADVDGSMMALARGTDWSAAIHSKAFDVNSIIQDAAMYYIYGNMSNPMLHMLQAAGGAARMMDTAIRKGQAATMFAGSVCPDLNEVHSEEWIAQIDSFVANMSTAMTAEYVWPHYDSLVRVSL